MHEPLYRSRCDTNTDLLFVYFIGLMESDPFDEGSYRPEEEDIGSHELVRSQGQDRREESSHGAAGRVQQEFLEQLTQILR